MPPTPDLGDLTGIRAKEADVKIANRIIGSAHGQSNLCLADSGQRVGSCLS